MNSKQCNNNKNEVLKIFLIDRSRSPLARWDPSTFWKSHQRYIIVLNLSLKMGIKLTSARDYRIARERQSTALSPHATVNDIFHSLQPHIALSASPESERMYLKLLSSGILAVLLPTEDLESECESTLIREVLSGMVLWNIVEKMSEPHIIFEMITKVCLS